jgi:hypothetical protein
MLLSACGTCTVNTRERSSVQLHIHVTHVGKTYRLATCPCHGGHALLRKVLLYTSRCQAKL